MPAPIFPVFAQTKIIYRKSRRQQFKNRQRDAAGIHVLENLTNRLGGSFLFHGNYRQLIFYQFRNNFFKFSAQILRRVISLVKFIVAALPAPKFHIIENNIQREHFLLVFVFRSPQIQRRSLAKIWRADFVFRHGNNRVNHFKFRIQRLRNVDIIVTLNVLAVFGSGPDGIFAEHRVINCREPLLSVQN